MRTLTARMMLLTACIALLLQSACGGTQADQGPHIQPEIGPKLAHHRVELRSLSTKDGLDVSLEFTRGESAGPRVAEIFLLATSNLSMVKAEAGQVLLDTGKQLTVRESPDGATRLVIYSATGLDELVTGSLARVHFERRGKGPAQVEIMQQRPLFAPAGANAGLEVGPALQF